MTSPGAHFILLLAAIIAVISLGAPLWALILVIVLVVVAALAELGANQQALKARVDRNDAR